MLTLPLGVGRDVTRAFVCARAVVCDEGLLVVLGKVELAELGLVVAPGEVELVAPPPLERAADLAAAVFVLLSCMGIAAAAATAAAVAAITTTTNHTVLTLIAPRRFLWWQRVVSASTCTDRASLPWGSPFMFAMLTQAASRAKVCR